MAVNVSGLSQVKVRGLGFFIGVSEKQKYEDVVLKCP